MQDGTIYKFSDFCLVADEDMLLRNGEPVPLPPKAFSTLLLLIERRGHLVRKSEIIEKVWTDSFVEESAVSRCVWIIRNALGDDSTTPRFIQTVPKRGYKFVADVVQGSEPGLAQVPSNGNVLAAVEASDLMHSSQPLTSPDRSDDKRVNGRRWRVYVAVAAIAIALASVAAWTLIPITTSTAGTQSGKRFAVLPLKPIDVANRSDVYEIGVADALIDRINSLKGFIARPLSATRHYNAINQDALAAGREQKVDYVLTSSYQLADGKFRLTAQLINVLSGQVEDSFKIETEANNVFAIQDSVAAEIGKRLISRFETTADTAYKRGTSNEEAYRDYLQGMLLFDQRKKNSIESFERAIELDPNYGLAWAGKARALRIIDPPAESEDQHELYRRSMEAVNRALEIDPELADAYGALCTNKANYEYDFEGAERACKRALELDPNSSLAHLNYAGFLNGRGRHDEAISSVKKAIDLDPSSFFNQRHYANTLYLARRYDEARSQYLRLWELNPNQKPTYEWMIRTLDASGKHEEAFEWFVRSLKLQKLDEQIVDRYRLIFNEYGWLGVLREREKTDQEGLNVFRRAGLNAQIGNKDRAFELLNQAYERRMTMFPILAVDPQFDPLRDDPRYVELVARMRSK